MPLAFLHFFIKFSCIHEKYLNRIKIDFFFPLTKGLMGFYWGKMIAFASKYTFIEREGIKKFNSGNLRRKTSRKLPSLSMGLWEEYTNTVFILLSQSYIHTERKLLLPKMYHAHLRETKSSHEIIQIQSTFKTHKRDDDDNCQLRTLFQ